MNSLPNTLLLASLLVFLQSCNILPLNIATDKVQANPPNPSQEEIPNRLIDYRAFESQVLVVGEIRNARRVTEEEFMEMSKDSNTIIFDARSKERFNMLHIKGAKHLSLPDITEAELAKVVPNKSTRILIYCNNNFLNAPDAFPSKAPNASLNIHTINVLYAYGYKNVYELGPLIDINKTQIEFVGQKR